MAKFDSAETLHAHIQAQRQAANDLASAGDLAAALSTLNALSEDVQQSPFTYLLGWVWLGRAVVLDTCGQTNEALAASAESAAIFQQHGSQSDAARARVIAVYLLGLSGKYDEAHELAAWIESIFIDDPVGLAMLKGNVGQVYEWQWELKKASTVYQEALAIWQQVGAERPAAIVRHDLALVAERLDQCSYATAQLEALLPIFATLNEHEMLAKTLFNLARLDIRSGRLQQALTRLRKARATTHESLASIDMYEARVLRLLNQYDEAEQLLKASLAEFTNRNWVVDILAALYELTDLYVSQELPERALAVLHETSLRIDSVRMPLPAALILLRQASLQQKLGVASAAIQHLEQARPAFAAANLPLRIAYCDLMLAQCLETTNPQKSHQLYHTVLGVIKGTLPLECANAWRGLGRLSADPTNAVAAYERAYEQLSSIQSELHTHHQRASFAEDKRQLLEELLAALQRQHKPENTLYRWLEIFKTDALNDQLTALPANGGERSDEREQVRRDLDYHLSTVTGNPEDNGKNRFRSVTQSTAYDEHRIATIQMLRRRLRALDESQKIPSFNVAIRSPDAILDSESAYLSYYETSDQLFALVATANDISHQRLGVSLQQIEQIWRRTKRDVTRPATQIVRAQTGLKMLYAALIEPVAVLFEGSKQLLISPIRSLGSLPFAALFDGKQYLCERFTLCMVPSLSLYDVWRRRPVTEGKPLLVGYPGDEKMGGYLGSVSAEINTIKSIYPSATVLFDQKASLSLVKTEMNGRPFIHFAGHIFFNQKQPLESGIPLAEGEWLRVSDLYASKINLGGATIVLSGCNSGKGTSKGWDSIGLNAGFLYAGAKSVVSSLWKVEDHATRMLMANFYSQWNLSHTAYALCQAQLALLGSAPTAHPFFWAGFNVTGGE